MVQKLIEKYEQHKLCLIVCAGVWLLNFLLWGICALIGQLGAYIYMLNLVVCISFGLNVYLAVRKRGFPSLEVLFLGCLFLFNISRLFLYIFGIYDFMNSTYATFPVFAWEDKTAITVLNSYLIFLSVMALYLCIHEKKWYGMSVKRRFPAESQVLTICYGVFLICAPIYALYLMRQVAVVSSVGYGGLFNGAVEQAFHPGPLFSVSRLAFTIAIGMVCALERNERRFNVAFLVYILVIAIQLLQGSRLEVIVEVLFFLYMRFRLFNRRIPLLWAAAFLVVGILGIYFVACLRSNTLSSFSIGGALRYFFVSMSGSLNVPAYYLQNKEALSNNAYPYILDPIVRLFHVIWRPELVNGQSLELIAGRSSLSHQITFHISSSYYLSGAGVGSNFLAELLEFGIPGVLFGSVLLVKLISLLDENLGRSYYLRFMGSAFVGKIFITPRAEFFYDTYNLVKYGLIFGVIYLFGCICYKRTVNLSKAMKHNFDFGKHYALFEQGMKTRLALGGEDPFTKKRNLKILLCYVLVAIFSPYRKKRIKSAYFVASKAQRGWKFDVPADEKLYRGFCYHSVGELWKLYTAFSPFNRFERFALLCEMIGVYMKNKKNVQHLSVWLEYCTLNWFFQHANLETFIARNHFDEFAYWIGCFAQMYGFRFCEYQHGVVFDTTELPYKVYCDEFYAFDNYSVNAFRKCYHSNPQCKYAVYPFGPSVKLEELQREPGKLYIGIAEQNNPKWTEQILAVTRQISSAETYVMMHPLSTANYSGAGIKVEREKKFVNFDVLITEHSTLAIDFYRARPDMRVIFTSELIKNCFADYPFMHVPDVDQLVAFLRNIEESLYD